MAYKTCCMQQGDHFIDNIQNEEAKDARTSCHAWNTQQIVANTQVGQEARISFNLSCWAWTPWFSSWGLWFAIASCTCTESLTLMPHPSLRKTTSLPMRL
eukprot:3443968-Amphidinium_carterae.2